MCITCCYKKDTREVRGLQVNTSAALMQVLDARREDLRAAIISEWEEPAVIAICLIVTRQ